MRLAGVLDGFRLTIKDYEGQKLSVTLSFGIAPLSQNQDITRNELIKRADGALYQAKGTGRNKYCVFRSNQQKK